MSLCLQAKDGGGGFLPCFDTRLVVRVDVNQGRVEANGAFEKRDERSQGPRIHLADRDGHRLAVVSVKSLPRANQKAVEIISGPNAGLDLDRSSAGLKDSHERYKKIVHAVAQLLDIRVLIRGTFVAIDGDSLLDPVAIEIELFSQRFHHQLLQVAAE